MSGRIAFPGGLDRRLAIAIAIGAGGFSASPVAPVWAQQLTSTAADRPAITRHQGVFNGKAVRYTATIAETVVPNAAGVPAARIVSVAYTADGGDRVSRPVLFACNGGPIVSSWLLHMLALGPRRLAIPDDLAADPSTFKLVDNVYTVLDVADIVFYDPASTGWSRVLDGTKPQDYYSVEADAQQMAAFVDEWTRRNGRRSSPTYLLGESYATIRVAETARMLSELPEPLYVDGLFLMGQAVNQLEISTRPHNIVSYVAGLPSIAATAWYHNKIDRGGRTVYQVMEEAFRFGREEYLPALYQGHALHDVARIRIAARLEALSGLPAAYFLANNLRTSRPAFLNELFRAEGLKLGWDDGRYLGPANGPNPDGAPVERSYEALVVYLRDELKAGRMEEYRRRQPPADPAPGAERPQGRSQAPPNPGTGWVWGPGAPNPFGDFPYVASVTGLFARNPRFRVVLGSGIYDLKTTTGGAAYLLAQAGWPTDRVRLSYYEGGHMAYTNESALKKFTDDVRALVRGR